MIGDNVMDVFSLSYHYFILLLSLFSNLYFNFPLSLSTNLPAAEKAGARCSVTT